MRRRSTRSMEMRSPARTTNGLPWPYLGFRYGASVPWNTRLVLPSTQPALEPKYPEVGRPLDGGLQERGADAGAPRILLKERDHAGIEAARGQVAHDGPLLQPLGLVAQAHQLLGQAVQLLVAEAAGADGLDLVVDDG